ncbi:MAG: hypothetical protein PWP35_281 [Bacteroidales bacterium]|jgi:lipid II:glycine glycyltransferase (peptidoglycan interpeptide bridge formation enzyme)|nr:hypothetical protein [Bacteroidales bacterium]
MIVTEINEDYLKSLEEFVYNHPHGNFFQSPKAYNFYKSLPAFNPVLLLSVDESGEINGSLLAVIQKEKGFLKSFLSRRCIITGGPIIKDGNKNIADRLLNELIKKVRRKSIYIEFRNLFDLSEYKEIFEKNGFKYKEHLNFIVNIESPEENFRKLNDNRQRQIKKSLKEGTEIVNPKGIDEVYQFYLILKRLYKERVKKPLPDFSFFKSFFNKADLGKYFLVKFEDKVIGGIMCPVFKDKIYEWYVCGLDTEYKNQAPSVLATWSAIEYAAKNGLKYFDFMGAGSPESDYGVREFKSKFGGELVEYGRFLRINYKLLYGLGKLGLKVLGFLK